MMPAVTEEQDLQGFDVPAPISVHSSGAYPRGTLSSINVREGGIWVSHLIQKCMTMWLCARACV